MRQDPTAEQVEFFETRVRPVLANNCFSCHGDKKQFSGLRLDSFEAMLKGGDEGPGIVPGDPEKSRLIEVIRYNGPIKMPKAGKLPANQIADLEAWVKMGAPWPKKAGSKGSETKTHWSLLPVPAKVAAPVVKQADWAKNPVDAFILAKLEAKKFAPAPAADRRTLIRRLSYDLIGLPPTLAEVTSFVGDKQPGAYERLVDRLLASPRYGERWGRQWLDVARYADTKGYVFEEDRRYEDAYSYREWVIKAMNSDLPYDQFLMRQLAADQLPEVANGDDKSAVAAMGYLTLGRRFINQEPDIIDDRIDVTMRGMQGLTVACARCHDHKFDPIPTQDYYSLYGVFASSQDTKIPISERAIREPWQRFSDKVDATNQAIFALVDRQVARLRKLAKEANGLSPEVKQVLQGIREETRPDGENLKKLAVAFEKPEADQLGSLQSQLASLKASPPPTPQFALALLDKPDPRDTYVFKRGNIGNPGPTAPRRFLLALSKPGIERPLWRNGSGRIDLARSIASKENPLTARVIVNRVWQGHFGAGLVRTPSDFGRQGELPTHPELLDYLARWFMESGWSMKKLHRLIVTSNTYKQSSEVSKERRDADPENRLWSHANRRRLDLEQMRDTALFVAGRLDLSKVGGRSEELWNKPFSNRRAVYGYVDRQNLPGTFRTFDFASPDSTSARRFQTTVPQQALFWLNSPFSVEQATAISSRREVTLNTQLEGQVKEIFRIVLGRSPMPEEAKVAASYASLPAPKPIRTAWAYGYGKIDVDSNQVTGFTELGTFGAQGYQVGSAFPDPQLGYILAGNGGGHPGNDLDHSVVWRWTSPVEGRVRLEGELGHDSKEGDGVRASVVKGGNVLVGRLRVHHEKRNWIFPSVVVKKGETIDFVVDPITGPGNDGFSFKVVLRSEEGTQKWDSSAEFGPPSPAPPSRATLFAQALLMTNEFMFVD